MTRSTLRALVAPLVLLAVAACKPEPIPLNSTGPTEGVKLIAIAPDGTKLWRIGDIHFSAAGTSRRVSCGKSCTRDELVPNAAGNAP